MTTLLKLHVYKVVDDLIFQFERIPQGHAVWKGLPLKGKKSADSYRRRWTNYITQALYPQALVDIMLLASVNEDGIPDRRGKLLYGWLLKNAYSNDIKKLYERWLIVKKVNDGS